MKLKSGTWQASLQYFGRPVDHVIHVSQQGGAVAVKMDIPERLDFDRPVESVTFENGKLRFSIGSAIYEGRLSSDAQTIDGTWSVGLEQQTVNWKLTSVKPGKL